MNLTFNFQEKYYSLLFRLSKQKLDSTVCKTQTGQKLLKKAEQSSWTLTSHPTFGIRFREAVRFEILDQVLGKSPFPVQMERTTGTALK